MNRFLTVPGLALFATLPFLFQSTPKTAAATTVAHWRFQNGVKGAVAHSTHLIEDSSGHDRHGTAIGGPTFRGVDLPESNLAMAFHGHDDRVFVPDDEAFHLTKNLTLEAYVQLHDYSDGLRQILFRGDDRGGFDPWFLGILASGQLVFLVTDAQNRCAQVRSPEPIPRVFTHVAGTLDHETGELSVFVNGKKVATTKTKIRPCGALGGRNPGVGIGNVQRHSDQAFHGLIDEVRISSVALDPQDMLPAPSSAR
ncbi:MAG: LamG domain-containing protein [Planctomycetota bacterium]